ncbi:MAG TPA: NAD(P) transhydrogenase subunit alpha [Candidatus Limnocylindria bacterium]|nr:NAD(P) transhydrogenase subunit alpha [Candidatus Limnocylindria bacterium]
MTMDQATLVENAQRLALEAARLADQAATLAGEAMLLTVTGQPLVEPHGNFLALLTVFALACFVGFYVVWSVTPALHSPLMSVTNAISSVIIVGGLLAAGPAHIDFSSLMGFFAVTLASVNIFGGFIVTYRMLQMFKKKKR